MKKPIIRMMIIAVLLINVTVSAESFDAVPSSRQIILNDEPLILYGLKINDQMYFSMEEIAGMLSQTRANFDFRFWSMFDGTHEITIQRWGTFKPPQEPNKIEPGISTVVNINILTHMTRDFWQSEVSAMEVNGGIYFNLNNLGSILGYIYRTENGIAHINTMEPNISEYGFIAARDFLSARPTLFADIWTDEIRAVTPAHRRDWWPDQRYDFPLRYRLYDFDNTGIPDILMMYDFSEEGLWGTHILYVYENGEYIRAGELSYWGELFTDGQGNFYSLEGSHQEGFARIIHFAFTDEGVIWEILADCGYLVWQLPESEREPLLEQSKAVWSEVSL